MVATQPITIFTAGATVLPVTAKAQPLRAAEALAAPLASATVLQ